MSSTDNIDDVQPDQSAFKPSAVRSKDAGQFPHGTGMWNRLDARLTRSAGGAQPRQDDSEYLSALRLVQKASETIDTLQDRCRRLEQGARDTNERVKNEAESSERVIKDWERLANALKVQLSKSEGSLAETMEKLKAAEVRASALEARVQANETRLQESETRAQKAESRANTAEQLVAQEIELASSFRQTILETFGSGSRLSAVLAGEPGH